MDTRRFSLPTRWLTWAFVLLHGLGWTSAAGASELLPSPFAGPDTDDKAGYQKIIREGVAEYQAGRFEEALSLFRRAHEMSPSSRTFRGIGMASFELRDYVTAVRGLSAALQDKRKPLSSEQRKDAQGLLDRSLVFVDVYAVKLLPRTARLLVDGRTPELEPDGTLLLGFGVHAFEASASGWAKLSRSVEPARICSCRSNQHPPPTPLVRAPCPRPR
jgi:tetratricopeptide (TPR) repeat protein